MATVDELTSDGLLTKDNLELVDELTTGFQNIYSQNGEELNFESNTPDGQLIQIISELGTVMRELITEVYNSCDPDKCVGSVQDNRYQINYLTRKAGAFTLQNVAITVNKTVTLQGLDAMFNDEDAAAYTVSDDSGNIWYLVDTTTLYAGTTSLEFRAKEKGEIIPIIGTITNQVTIVEGVTNVINNVGVTSVGYEEESDSDFRIRRSISTETKSENNIDSIRGNLLNLDNVFEVVVHQNTTNSTDSTGTPAHYIWVVVEGGNADDIAQIIYANMGGTGTKGNESKTIYSSSLQPITIHYDKAQVIPLYIKFDLQPINLAEINQDFLKEYIANNLTYSIGEEAETSKVGEVCANAMVADGANGYALNPKISTGGTASITTTSTTISNLSVSVVDFQAACSDTAGSYVFTYTSDKWQLSGDDVDIADYGITYTGTPAASDTITVAYTASVWTDYIAVTSLADKFTPDESKITINVIE